VLYQLSYVGQTPANLHLAATDTRVGGRPVMRIAGCMSGAV
jgi:hypothetical protein